MLIQQLLEAKKKNDDKKTTTQDKVDLGLDDLLADKSKGSLAKPDEPEVKAKSEPTLKAAGAEKTRSKAASATIDSTQAPEFNADELDTSKEIDDDEARANTRTSSHHEITPGVKPKPVTPNTLPAIISKAMTTTGKGVTNIEPEWHMVKHLPGYMSRAIRTLGRAVFSPFTSTAIEDIQVVAHVGGGPNSEAEVDAVSRYVSANGDRDKVAELHFQKVLPDYSAQVVSYNCEGITFFMVKDFAGHYIYAWPEKDSKDIKGTSTPRGIEQTRAQLTHDRKQIGHDKPDDKDIEDLMKKYGL